MKIQSYKFLFFVSWFLIMSTAAGCTNSDQSTLVNTETPTITPKPLSSTPTLIPSSTPSTENILEYTPTSTMTPTQTQEPTPTLVQVPTLIPQAMQETIENLLTTNGDCRFPCWWGINPGSTFWSDAYAFLSQFDSEIYITTGAVEQFADIYIPLTESLSPSFGAGVVDITVDSGIVKTIKVSSFWGAEQYFAGELLEEYGGPLKIWISTEITVGTEFPFIVILYYPDQGFIYVFTELTEKAGDTLHVCLERGATLMFWSPSPELSFQNVANMFNWDVASVPFMPLEDATNIDTNQFFNLNAGLQEGICIDTPTDLWPQE